MTLWTFGDSFVDSTSEEHYSEEQWTNQVAAKLNIEHMSLGVAGTNLTYTYMEFNKNIENFNDNDIVIICLTKPYSKWFFKDVLSINDLYFRNEDEQRAIKYYRQYLDNTINDYTYLDNFLYTVKSIAKRKNLRVIILNSVYDTINYLIGNKQKFEGLYTVYYPLTSIERNEMTIAFYSKWIDNTITNDCRVNHLCRSNHNILANKVVDYIKYNTDIDLNKGFVKNIIDFDKEHDQDFQRIELFGKRWAFWDRYEDIFKT